MSPIDRGASDIGYAVRTLLRQPAFSGTVVATLAVAIGANVAIFTMINALVLRPLPYPEVARVVAVSSTPKAATRRLGASYADYADWRARARSFDAIGLAGGGSFALKDDGVTQLVDGARCTADLFRVIGIPPLVGRTFTEREDRPSADPVVVLSQGLWERSFGGDRSVVGRVVALDGRDAVVVGVMPRDFAFPDHAELWTPFAGDPAREERSARGYSVLARLRPGVSSSAADAEMRHIGTVLGREHPVTNGNVTVFVDPLSGPRGPHGVTFAFVVALGAGGFVLLIACANVVNLLLARTSSRSRELAVRLALGATRFQISRLLFTEAVVLTVPAAVLGLFIGQGGRDAMIAAVPSGIPTWMRFDTDWRILAFTAGISALTAVAVTLSPGFRVARRPFVDALKQAGSSDQHGRSGARGALVVCEIAITLVLLTGAGLMTRTFFNVARVDPGFRPDGLLSTRLTLRGDGYSPQRLAAVYASVAERVGALPGVTGVALASSLPFAAEGRTWGAEYETQDTEPGRIGPLALRSAVSEGYFRVTGLPLLAGRAFQAGDGPHAVSVAIVSRALAERQWPNQDPLGKRLRFRVAGGTPSPWLTIVGIADDVRYWRLQDDGLPWVYVPLAQAPSTAVSLVARSGADVRRLVQAEMTRTDANLPIGEVLWFEEVIDRSLWAERLFARVFEVFGAVALGLALVGIYGVVSYSAHQRTREMAIRAALGGNPRALGWLIVRDGGRLALAGIGVGLAGAWATAGAMSRLLYGVTPHDPPTFVVVSLLLFSVSCVAAYIPARAAIRVDPLTALRRH